MIHSAGFLLARRRTDAPGDSLAQLSLSPCIGFFLPGGWCYDWIEGPDEDARTFAGLTPEQYKSLMDEVREGTGSVFGYDNVIFARDAAEGLLQRYAGAGGFRMVEAALDEADAEQYLQMAAPAPTVPGYAPSGAGGLFEKLLRREPVQPDAVLLGFEPLNYTVGAAKPDCSLACLEKNRVTTVQLNAAHLIDNLCTARRVCQELESDQRRARPGRWFPWAIFAVPPRAVLGPRELSATRSEAL